MPGSELDLIERYFKHGAPSRGDVIVGIGDDGAVLQVPQGKELVVSIDTLLAGVHFETDINPQSIGFKAMAVNLSDMAAMGADPAWVTLSLTLPGIDHGWLKGFSQGLFQLADQFDVQLVGGDLSHGPLAITIQVHGFVNTGKSLRRDTARTGDQIFVTGTLGDAGLALAIRNGGCPVPQTGYDYLCQRLDRPQPRVKEGISLQDVAHSAIDISDGLACDLGHIIAASDVGATVYVDRIPVSPVFATFRKDCESVRKWADIAVSSGDDYELCFTIDPRDQALLKERMPDIPCTQIGIIDTQPGLRCMMRDGSEFVPTSSGYDHFRDG